jgi:hypothetical protein
MIPQLNKSRDMYCKKLFIQGTVDQNISATDLYLSHPIRCHPYYHKHIYIFFTQFLLLKIRKIMVKDLVILILLHTFLMNYLVLTLESIYKIFVHIKNFYARMTSQICAHASPGMPTVVI